MNKFILILFLCLSGTLSAQSLYNPRANTDVGYKNTENFSVTFTKTMHGITFKRNDRMLTEGLKTSINHFMATTNRTQFKGLGVFTLNIIKRQDTYFVVEKIRPERLIEL